MWAGGQVLPVDFLPSLGLPGFPQFDATIVPLKVRKTPGKYLLPHEEEAQALKRWNIATRRFVTQVLPACLSATHSGTAAACMLQVAMSIVPG